ncbi:MAG: hypothetical protein QNJ31_08085 [Candidatus Caenarcaniphilales bacterium]|nr:hypothetical protein [Candidatus Caenarcaniphilales bacterium]
MSEEMLLASDSGYLPRFNVEQKQNTEKQKEETKASQGKKEPPSQRVFYKNQAHWNETNQNKGNTPKDEFKTALDKLRAQGKSSQITEKNLKLPDDFTKIEAPNGEIFFVGGQSTAKTTDDIVVKQTKSGELVQQPIDSIENKDKEVLLKAGIKFEGLYLKASHRSQINRLIALIPSYEDRIKLYRLLKKEMGTESVNLTEIRDLFKYLPSEHSEKYSLKFTASNKAKADLIVYIYTIGEASPTINPQGDPGFTMSTNKNKRRLSLEIVKPIEDPLSTFTEIRRHFDNNFELTDTVFMGKIVKKTTSILKISEAEIDSWYKEGQLISKDQKEKLLVLQESSPSLKLKVQYQSISNKKDNESLKQKYELIITNADGISHTIKEDGSLTSRIKSFQNKIQEKKERDSNPIVTSSNSFWSWVDQGINKIKSFFSRS